MRAPGEASCSSSTGNRQTSFSIFPASLTESSGEHNFFVKSLFNWSRNCFFKKAIGPPLLTKEIVQKPPTGLLKALETECIVLDDSGSEQRSAVKKTPTRNFRLNTKLIQQKRSSLGKSPLLSGKNRICKPARSSVMTPLQSIRLKDKEDYRRLLNMYAKDGPFVKSPKSLRDVAVMADFSSRPSTPPRTVFSPKVPSSVYKHFVSRQRTSSLNGGVFDGRDAQSSSTKSPRSSTVVANGSDRNGGSRRFSSTSLSMYDDKWLSDLKTQLSLMEEDRTRKKVEAEHSAEELLSRRDSYREFRREKQKAAAAASARKAAAAVPLKPLTPEMNEVINSALCPTPPSEVLVEGFRLQLCRRDIDTLSGLNWLNDEVINFYMNLIIERGKNDNFPRVYAFNTFFYPKLMSSGYAAVKRWTRREDLFANRFILVPVHLGMHWCLAVCDMQRKRVDYYDSMGGTNNACVNTLLQYLSDEAREKSKSFNAEEWSLNMIKNIPQQMNGSDCGMFACKYAEYVTRDAPITFSQTDMPYFRRRMVYEIITKTLL